MGSIFLLTQNRQNEKRGRTSLQTKIPESFRWSAEQARREQEREGVVQSLDVSFWGYCAQREKTIIYI